MRTYQALAAVAALFLAGCTETGITEPGDPSLGMGAGAPGTVYVLSNAVAGNEVLVFDRGPDGTLTPAGSFGTGGTGTGAGLGSQGALVLSENGNWLVAVNAGSNEISLFRVRQSGLELTDTEPSGGQQPISATISGSLVYALNAGGDGNITGFSLSPQGELSMLVGSTRPLSGPAAGPAQVEFTPDGRTLVVTEKASNRVVTYGVDMSGYASAPIAHASAGMTPFGFGFSGRDRLIVSEAFGGAPDASAVSSYRLGRNGSVETVSGAVPTTETAACWIAVSRDGRFAYTTNAGSGSVSGYSVAPDGSLALLDADGVTGMTGAASTPTDLAFSQNGRFLYVNAAGAHAVVGFTIASDGSLGPMGSLAVLPAGAVGIAAR